MHLRAICERSAYPPIVEQAGNVMGAIGRVVGAVARGHAVRVDQAERDRRMGVCLVCPHFDGPSNRCRKCGCTLAVKPWMKTEVCPIGSWAQTEGET